MKLVKVVGFVAVAQANPVSLQQAADLLGGRQFGLTYAIESRQPNGLHLQALSAFIQSKGVTVVPNYPRHGKFYEVIPTNQWKCADQ